MPCSTSAAATLARDPAEVQHLRPMVLIGTSTVAGAFSLAEATPQT